MEKPDDNVSIPGFRLIAPKAVVVKEGDLLFTLTTGAVILVKLIAKNGYVAWTLSCCSGNIIAQGVFTPHHCGCLRDFNHVSAYSFLLLFLVLCLQGPPVMTSFPPWDNKAFGF